MVVAAAAVAPLGFACISYLTRGAFEGDEDLLNRTEQVPESAVTSEPEAATPEIKSSGYNALAPRTIALLGICLVVGGMLAWPLKPRHIAEYLELPVNARTAPPRADRTLRQRGPHSSSH